MKEAAVAILMGRLTEPDAARAELKPPAKAEPLDYTEPSYLPQWWREELEKETAPFRRAKAARHRLAQYSAQAELRAAQLTGCMPPHPVYGRVSGPVDLTGTAREAWTRAVWHSQRATGEMQRFVNLANCGDSFEVQGDCTACGSETVKPVFCGLVTLCPRCRGRAAHRLRSKTRECMAALPPEYKTAADRQHQRWGWKMLTLTVPHGRGIEADVKALATRLWPAFWRQLKAHIEKDLGETLPPLMVRALEIAKTGDDDGHAHYHVALFTPFVPKCYLNFLWGRQLERCGYECPRAGVADVLAGNAPGTEAIHPHFYEQTKALFVTRRGNAGRPLCGPVPFAVTDIREAYGDDGDLCQELVKYIVKDVHNGQRIAPRDFAAIYRAVSGRRRFSQSKSLRPPPPSPAPCPHCAADAMDWTSVSLREREKPTHTPFSAERDSVRETMHAEALCYHRRAQREAKMRAPACAQQLLGLKETCLV